MDFLLKFSFFQKLWGHQPQDQSRSAARERLQSALVGDRGSVAPGLLSSLETELLPILRRYMDIDRGNLKLALADREGQMRFSASVPVLRIHRQAHLPDQALSTPTQGRAREGEMQSPLSTSGAGSRRKLRGPRGRRSSEELPAINS